MPEFRIGDAATLLGVSTDTVRRWADTGLLQTKRTEGGHRVVDGKALAAFMRSRFEPSDEHQTSARNRFTGVVTNVVRDRVAASVEIQSGPHRIISLMTREAADDLRLEPGMMVTAIVKATNVVISA